MTPGFIATACSGFLETYSLWMETLISLDVVRRALDLPQSKVPYPLLGLKGIGVEGMGEREWEFELVFF